MKNNIHIYNSIRTWMTYSHGWKKIIPTSAFPWKEVIAINFTMRRDLQTIHFVIWNDHSSYAGPTLLALVSTSRRLWPYHHFDAFIQILIAFIEHGSTWSTTKFTRLVGSQNRRIKDKERGLDNKSQKRHVEFIIFLTIYDQITLDLK